MIRTKLTLRELLATETTESITGYVRSYLIAKHGGKCPIAQTVETFLPYGTNLMASCTAWLSDRASNRGMDVNIGPLISNTVSTFETPMTEVSSEIPSSRTLISTDHSGEYIKYLSQRLGFEVNEYESFIDSMVADWWMTGTIMAGYRCY